MVNIFYRTIFTLALFILVSMSAAQAQNNTDLGYIPPVISLLLDDQQCPIVRLATTVTGTQDISTQADLNALAGITKIDGSIIFGSSLMSLDFSPLDSLVEVTGGLFFFDTLLTEIDGFDCLQSADELLVEFNFDLISVAGFSELAEINQISFIFNPNLSSLPEFPKVTRIVDSFIDTSGGLKISAFPRLVEVGQSLAIFGGPSQGSNLPEFPELIEVGGDLIIQDLFANNNLSGFPKLIRVGRDLEIRSNSDLTSISGFPQLAEVGEDLVIEDNFSLISITGFNLLESADVIGNIIVNDNDNYDCTNPTPNFSPVNESEANLVNCSLVPKTVFLSQQSTNGAIGGVDGADQLCQDEASDAGLSGTYLAWLSSDDTTTAPINRFVQSAGPYVRPDNVVVADNWVDLTDGTIDNFICVEADGNSQCGTSGPVWTNVDESGNTIFSVANDACDNWTVGDVSADGRRGFYGSASWSSANDASCGETAALYCFEQ